MQSSLRRPARCGVRVGVETMRAEELCLHFAVTDTGIGIARDKHDMIFQPFVQADVSMTRKYGGTGLGLSICARLVDLMHGNMWLESELSQGSTFHFQAHLGVPSAEQDRTLPDLRSSHAGREAAFTATVNKTSWRALSKKAASPSHKPRKTRQNTVSLLFAVASPALSVARPASIYWKLAVRSVD